MGSGDAQLYFLKDFHGKVLCNVQEKFCNCDTRGGRSSVHGVEVVHLQGESVIYSERPYYDIEAYVY